MFKSTAFKTAFISTIIFLTTILLLLITDYNTKNSNFRNSPSLFKIENVNSEYYDVELIGNKFQFRPIKIKMDKTQQFILQALIPRKLKAIENFIYSSYTAYNDFINYKKNLEYLENIKK